MSVYWVTPPLCLSMGNPNWSFMALKAAKQARAAASSPGRRQISQDPVVLPICLGHSSLLPCRRAVDCCSQRMSAVISGKRRDVEGCMGEITSWWRLQARGRFTCRMLLGHSLSDKCRRALSSERTTSPWSCGSGSLPTWSVCSDDWHKLLLEDKILALLW